jgi:hypothetical protein
MDRPPIESKRALILAPAFDTPGRKDASGAFQPEARKFVAANGLLASVCLFDSNRAMTDRRYEAARAISRSSGVHVFALFCHGWKDGIQAGWRAKDAPALADLLVLAGSPACTVVLYACDAARDADADRDDDRQPGPGGEGGFADLLAQAMIARKWSGRLFAHSTAGHTTQNPHVRTWGGDPAEHVQERGEWWIEPKSALWPAWRAALQGDLRFKFPFHTRAETKTLLRP